MAADIRLTDDKLILIGNTIAATAHDLQLDNREQPHNDSRRALAHDDDALVLNYEGDYPDGVRIDGKQLRVGIGVFIKADVAPTGASHPTPPALGKGGAVRAPEPILPRLGRTNEELRISRSTIVASWVEPRPSGVAASAGHPADGRRELDFVAELTALRKELDALRAQLDSLRPAAGPTG